MLTHIRIRNIALIASVELEFHAGLTVLTGETGAGKSILIDSINLGVGARSDRSLIRTGCEDASVEMLFDLSGQSAAQAQLAEFDIPCEGGELLVSRRLSLSGRNVCRINGTLATLAQLQAVMAHLIDLHGQHEHQSLLNEARHIELLDAFGGEELAALRAAYHSHWAQYRAALQQMRKLFGTEQERARRLDILAYQIDEIQAAALYDGEEEELAARIALLQHAQEIAQCGTQAYEQLYAGSEGYVPALDSIAHASQALSRVESYVPQLRALCARLESAAIELDDIAGDLRAILDDVHTDDHALESAHDRLDTIRRLQRKYGPTIADILRTLDTLLTEQTQLDTAQQRIEQMRAQIQTHEAALLTAGTRLSALRAKTAQAFERRILTQLADLGMPHSQFTARIHTVQGDMEHMATPTGFDTVAFYLSTNPGEPLKPLAQIASGGEMSRIMLAIKTICADADGIPTLIFDEIDTGISGEMARVTAEKLAAISRARQVLCVTHTAQIAAMGDNHLLIHKQTDGHTTATRVQALSAQQRREELARLVGGDQSALSRDHAAQLLGWSDTFKRALR